MKIIKEIAGRIFALWALVMFVITLIPAYISIFFTGHLDEPDKTEAFRRIAKVWMKIFFFLAWCRLKIKGLSNFKKGENYIVISNHNSLFDVPLLTPFIPGANKTIAKVEMAKTPLFGMIYKRGSVLVDRKNKDSRRESYSKMKAVLDKGMHMCIYPEGTRNKTDKPLKEFHDGAFRLAIETKKPVIPAILFNTRKILPAHKIFFFWSCKLEMHFLAPRYITDTDTPEGLKEEMFNLMSNYYTSNQ
jgi:1-acyl-sn-glycerol-3-phosphate acyltransferase